jgi:hypothetical protein
VKQVMEQKQYACGFVDLRWIDNRQGLYDWFKNFNPDMAATTGDIARRKAMLAPL